MNKDQKLLYFLGQLKARIEGFYAFVGISGPLVDNLTELEEFFNRSIADLYSEDNDDKLIAEIEELVKNNTDHR